jgi:excinuclease UvrABC helicase subunit UvrB
MKPQRRREKAARLQPAHGITPTTVVRRIADIMEGARSEVPGAARANRHAPARRVAEPAAEYAAMDASRPPPRCKKLETQMYKHAQNLEFEEAARCATRSISCANGLCGIWPVPVYCAARAACRASHGRLAQR